MRTGEKKTVLVIGAGAAGLMAAAAAAEEGAAVTVLESMKKPGRKLLLTGNGRCNLTNLDAGLISAYRSDSGGNAQEVIASVIRQFGAEDTLAFFEKPVSTLRTAEAMCIRDPARRRVSCPSSLRK